MKKTITLFGGVLLLAAWSGCGANGGPVDWTAGKPSGGIAPKQQSSIELVREDLEISILDFNTYAVEANYLMSNPVAAARVTYGVPLYWVEEFRPKEAAEGIGIFVDGKEYHCKAVDPVQRKGEAEEEMVGPSGDAWCVTELEIPKGHAIQLKLKYRAALEYEDWEYSKSARRHFSPRKLNYPLKPAGYWQGNPDLQVRINLGPYAGHVAKAAPLGAATSGAVMSWKLPEANLKQLAQLQLEFDSTPLLQHQELAAWNINAIASRRLTGRLKASSTLSGPAYGVRNLMDGNAATAWCEGQQGDGTGESFTIQFDAEQGEYPCSIEGIALIPGYAKSAKSYRQNGRLSKLRIEDCDDPASYAVVSWKPSDTHNLSALFVPTFYNTFVPSELVEAVAGRWKTQGYEVPNYVGPSCLRFTILETVPGERYSDTCISELAFVRNCG